MCAIGLHYNADTNYTSTDKQRAWQIRTITVEIPKLTEIDHIDLGLNVLDAATTRSFPRLEKILLGFDTRNDMMHFEEEVVRRSMPNLSGSGKLKWALWDSKARNRWDSEGAWLRASPYSDNTEGTYILSLFRQCKSHVLCSFRLLPRPSV